MRALSLRAPGISFILVIGACQAPGSGGSGFVPPIDTADADGSPPDSQPGNGPDSLAPDPTDTTPAETTPPETTPAETTPAETTPAETTPPGCTDACQLWSTTCSGTNGYKLCAPDAGSGCSELGPFTSCQPGNSCQSGQCSGGCTVPEVLLVVDRSSSMLGPVWDTTTAELQRFMRAMGPGARLGMRPFPGNNNCYAGSIIPLALDAADDLIAELDEPSAASSTPLAAALEGVAQAFGDPDQSEHVVLLTDGSETCGEPEGVVRAAAALRAAGKRVHAIGLGHGYDDLLLREVAAAGGGRFWGAPDGSALRLALRALAGDATGCAQPDAGASICSQGECRDSSCDVDDDCPASAPRCDPETRSCGECANYSDCTISEPVCVLMESGATMCVSSDVCFGDDERENDDDGPLGATPIAVGDAPLDSRVCGDDDAGSWRESDWYRLSLPEGSFAIARLLWNDPSDLDLYLYDDNIEPLDASISETGNDESIDLSPWPAGTYYLEVRSFDGDPANAISYTLLVLEH